MTIGKTLPKFPNTFEGGTLLERNEAVFSLFYDASALFDAAKKLNPNSLRKARILKGLYEALITISFSAEGDVLEQQAAAAAKQLAPLLAAKNSATTPTVHLIGHAHIDHAWLWHIGESERKVARTFMNMARFAKEYPEFIFFQSQPCQLEIVQTEYPAVFTAIKAAFKNGNWEPNGGMWVEADCNLPSGESLVRQFLVGKAANKAMLGADYEADTLWLPDVFGYSAALPQILKGCRIKYFVTSKINWNDTTRFPYETFIWRGIDGTGVGTHFISAAGQGYNGRVTPDILVETWNTVQHKEVQSECIKSIGEGDGGTLRADLELARRTGDLEGIPKSAWRPVSAALDSIFASGAEFPEWRGELYLELHRGTYTTQSRTKRGNRKSEFALRHTELYSAIAGIKAGAPYPHEMLLACWKKLLTLQFHDVIPGSSIHRVYVEAEAAYKEIGTRLLEQDNAIAQKLAPPADGGIVLFNDLSWERRDTVSLPAKTLGNSCALKDDTGNNYPIQKYTGLDGTERAAFTPKLPSLGWTHFSSAESSDAASPFSYKENRLTTPFYQMRFDDVGRITSLVNTQSGRELVSEGGYFNALISAEDVPVFWDAWDIDADWTKHITPETRLLSTDVVADGAVCFRLRRKYNIGAASILVQDTVCYADDPRIDFETKVDWHEKWRLLKAAFDTNIDATQARCEVQYGHLFRNTHKNLPHDRAKFEICAHKWISLEETGAGIALLNDCKYGHDVEGGRMRLTLLRAPIAPDGEADQGEHAFTYSLLPFTGAFADSRIVCTGYELNAPAMAHEGSGNYSLFTIDGGSVIAESVKLPENGDTGSLVIRLYESLGGQARTTLHFSQKLSTAHETDMLEDNAQVIPFTGNELALEFKPFEIKTLVVRVFS